MNGLIIDLVYRVISELVHLVLVPLGNYSCPIHRVPKPNQRTKCNLIVLPRYFGLTTVIEATWHFRMWQKFICFAGKGIHLIKAVPFNFIAVAVQPVLRNEI